MKIAHNNPDPYWPWIITIACTVTGLTLWTGFLPDFRPMIVFAFLLVCPGMAYVQLLSINDSIIKVVLAIALSLSIDTIVAMILLASGAWAPLRGMMIIIAISLLGIILRINNAEPEEERKKADLSEDKSNS